MVSFLGVTTWDGLPMMSNLGNDNLRWVADGVNFGGNYNLGWVGIDAKLGNDNLGWVGIDAKFWE
eukprot:4781070-Amphidinium_carterae.1